MHPTLIIAAAETAEKKSILDSLGIDWTLLIIQIIAFLILVAILAKFVYPILVRAIDKREADIEASAEAADQARADAAASEERVQKLLDEARKDAAAIIETAHKESAAMVTEAEEKAAKKSDHMIKQAEARLQTDIADARRALRTETAELVAMATGKIIREKVDAHKDANLIKQALKEAE
ncbi:ATP synthase F0 subunit B [Candidatus Saccharibacteria bacterium]|nr:MAG: ATP synthase F0 subunit B [Candidatus Saccharibacteria bacterium]